MKMQEKEWRPNERKWPERVSKYVSISREEADKLFEVFKYRTGEGVRSYTGMIRWMINYSYDVMIEEEKNKENKDKEILRRPPE